MPTVVSSREILRLVEGFGVSGSWSWTFATNEHFWSPGLYRILGVAPIVHASYDLFFKLIHPDDCPPSMSPGDVMQVGMPSEQTFRILRPDHTVRTVLSRGELTVSPSGRPVGAMGVVVDVSDREVLARAQSLDRRRKRALFEQLGAFTSSTAFYPFRDFSQEWLDLVGLPKAELLEYPVLPVIAAERRHWQDFGRELYLSGKVVHTRPHLRLANGEVVQYRMVMAPLFDPQGRIESWANYIAPHHVAMPAPADVRAALEQRIEGAHLRAGRALLDWSMADLARASGLSVSTIRRLEEPGGMSERPSIGPVIAALRASGILFSLTSDSTIVVGIRRSESPVHH